MTSGYGDRPYQVNARDAVFAEWDAGVARTLAVLPTGCGKTILSAMIIEMFHAMTGMRTLFLATRTTLIDQAHDKFTSYGLDSAIEMAGQRSKLSDTLFGKSQVVVGCVPSMQGERLNGFDRDEFGLVIYDESHHIGAAQSQATINHFGGARLLGITATPKPGLGDYFDSKCFDYPITTAIYGDGADDVGGWLVPPVIKKCLVSVDLKGIRTTGGDFNLGDLEERLFPHMNEIADAVWKHCGRRQTVVFTPDCGSAQALADLIRRKHGLSCEYVAGTGGKFGMPRHERDDILKRYERGEFQVLVNCELLFEGWDCAPVKCVVNCRAIRREMLYRWIQMVGRGLRPCPETGFHDCIVVDLDWEADEAARDLCCVVDLFAADQVDEEVMKVARELERGRKKSGGADDKPLEPKELIEEAEEIVRVRTKLNIRASATVAEFRTVEVNPIVGAKTLGLKFTKKHDMDTKGNNPASASQLDYLKSLGIQRPEGVSKWGASKMINELVRRKKAGLATVEQVQRLVDRGVDAALAREMSALSARTALTEMAKIAKATEQRSLF